jgi:chromosome segregation protein
MQIVVIEIDNFKSFAEKTLIPFRSGFTTISGPNGSGKSNIIDSVLFCLGLSSSRVMRAEKLTDLINNLSKRREAMVRIGFGTPQPDDTGTFHPEADMLPQFWIARRIKETPSGTTSTYYINDKPCTLTDIHEYLAQFHISPGTYNVMMQGDVAGIVNMSAGERRKILDEMAGIADFDRKIDQAETELNTTATNIERNQIVLAELTERMDSLAKERETALKYQQLRTRHQGLERDKLAAEVQALDAELARLKTSIAQVDAQQAEHKQKTAQLQTQLAAAQVALQTVNADIQRKGEDQYLAIRHQMEGLKGHVDRKQQSITHHQGQLEDNANQRTQMHAEIARQTERKAELALSCDNLTSQIKEVADLWQHEHKAYQGLQQQLDGLLGDTQQIERQRLRGLLDAANDKLADLRRQQLDQQATLERQQADAQALQQRYEGQHQQLQDLSQRLEDNQKTLDTLLTDKTQAEQALETLQLSVSDHRIHLKSVRLEEDQARQQVMQLTAQKRAYEDVQFGRAVDMILQSDLDGVHGTLSQLADVPSDYTLALEIALGGRMQNLVVDNERVAQAGIEWLKNRRGGRATFLPLNKLNPARSLPRLPNGGGIVDFAVNLLTYDAAYNDVFAFALGDTLVVEDIEAARPLMRQYRMVTLDGSLLEKTGAMTGGSNPNRGGGVRFANTQGLEESLTQAEATTTRLQSKRQHLEHSIQQQEQQLGNQQKHVAHLQQQHIKQQAITDGLNEQLSTLRNSLAPIMRNAQSDASESTLEQQRLELEKQLTEQGQITAQHQQALDTLDAQFPAEQIEHLRQGIADQAFQVEYYDTQRRNLESDLKARQLEQQHHQQALDHYAERLTVLAEKDLEHQQAIVEAEADITQTQQQLLVLEQDIAQIDGELKALQQQRDLAQQHLLDLEKQKHGLERQAQQLADQRLGYQARTREITPKWQGLKQQWHTEHGDTPLPQDLPDMASLDEELTRLRQSMQRLEPVNMKAIQEFDEVAARQIDLNEKIVTLSDERQALLIRIAGYEDLKRQSFMQTFEQVDTHFKTIFAELSDGTGHLVLSDPSQPLTSGLTIQAQPRGKKMQRLEAMSGGEKSLTSLAFVFALQRVTPAPFYALDEVDQNLDGMNAERLAQLVKREAEHCQFVVVSLRKPMLSASNRTIGVTQKRDGITKVTGVLLRELTDTPLSAVPVPEVPSNLKAG